MASLRPFTYRPSVELHKRLRDEAWKRHLSVQKLLDMMLTAQLDYWDLLEANNITGNGQSMTSADLFPERGSDDTGA